MSHLTAGGRPEVLSLPRDRTDDEVDGERLAQPSTSFGSRRRDLVAVRCWRSIDAAQPTNMYALGLCCREFQRPIGHRHAPRGHPLLDGSDALVRAPVGCAGDGSSYDTGALLPD